MAFIIDGRFACCGGRFFEETNKRKRMSLVSGHRRGPSPKRRKELLEQQAYRCIYCEMSFGSSVYVGAKRKILRIEFDHTVPFAYAQDNRDLNFVAACQICNGLKSSFVFQTIEEARIKIAEEREKRGIAGKGMLTLPAELLPQKT